MNSEDLRFTRTVRHALDEQLDTLPEAAASRLAGARAAALARHKSGGSRGGMVRHAGWMARAAVVAPLLVMAVGVVTLYKQEQHRRLAEIAELDAAVLSDELPLTAYLDDGFNAYLEQRLQ